MNKYYILVLLACFWLSGCQSTGGGKSPYVKSNQKAAELNMRLGLNYLQRGDYEIALEKLEKALKQDPSLTSAHNTIAILYQRLGELDKAEKHYEQAVRRDPKYSEAQNNYGAFLCQQGRYKEAEKRFLAALENPLYRNPAQAYENAGLCASRIPNIELTEHYLSKALQLNPRLGKSLLALAEIRYDQSDYLAARGYIERYREASAWTPKVLLLAIKTENRLNDQDAVASYSVLLRGRFPDSEQSKQVQNGHY
jgi:type IV pilus assembly protein PilF